MITIINHTINVNKKVNCLALIVLTYFKGNYSSFQDSPLFHYSVLEITSSLI